jgi:acyl carrier protein
LTEGWWSFTDTDLRPNYAVINTDQWLKLLSDTEFSDARALPGADAPGVLAQQAVFISRSAQHITPQSGSNWLILDDGQLGQLLADELTAQGDHCVLINQHQDIPVNYEVHNNLIDLRPTQAVLYNSLSVDELKQLQHQITGGVLDVVQTLVRQNGSQPARLWLVTRGGQAVEKADENLPDVNAVQASVWGLSHVIEMEHPELNCTRIDLDASADNAANIASLVAELHREDTQETQIAYRDNTRLGRRLVKMPPAAFQPVTFKPDASYLITGGLTGLGLLVAEWMAERGAAHIALMGRRAPSEEANLTLQRLAQAGVHIEVVQGDVSVAEDVARAIQSVHSEAAPLRGVMHAAGALDDGTLMLQNWERFETVMKAKVFGTWHLHQLTHDLDFMVLFSSGASLLGSAGQGNHAAANAFMDGLAYYRQVRGLPTVSLNWGAWSGVGAAVDRNLDTRLDTISPTDGLLALERAMRQGIEGGHPQIALLPINWQRVAAETPDYVNKPFLSRLIGGTQDAAQQAASSAKVQESQKQSADSFLDELAATIPNKRIQLSRTRVRSHAAHVLGIDPDYPIKMQQPLSEIGLDSLMAVELRNVLGTMLGKPLPATIIFDYPTIDALTDFLKTTIPLDMSASVEASEPVEKDDELDMFSDDELASMLASKLDNITDDQ